MTTTQFRKIPGGALLVEGWPQTQKRQLRAEVEQWLIDVEGLDAFDAESAAEALWIGRTWWSDRYNGQTHDCSEHDATERGAGCYPDSRKVLVISGVGEWD